MKNKLRSSLLSLQLYSPIVVDWSQVIAQKFLHDSIYTLTTWSGVVCERRPDIHRNNIRITEQLMLSHISWKVNMIADEATLAGYVTKVFAEASVASFRYATYLRSKLQYFQHEFNTNGVGTPREDWLPCLYAVICSEDGNYSIFQTNVLSSTESCIGWTQ